VPFVFIVLLALIALVRGCAADEPQATSPPASACRGRAAPVHEQLLIDTVGRYGFELYREDLCAGAGNEPAAMFTNIPASLFDEPEGDVIFASDSQVWCDLYRQDRFGEEVRRTRLEEEGEVRIRVLNVECRIYEVDAWHVERLALALAQLPKASPG
jgi:hypothetical protein